MPILIDGHNLIGHLPMLSLQDPDDEEELVILLNSYQARTGKAVTVIFDPGEAFALPHSYHRGGLKIVFAPHGSSADAVILRRVQRSRDPGQWLVVTSDQQLAEAVRRQGARVRSAEDLAAELTGQAGSATWKDRLLSPAEVQAWLALFERQD